MKARKKKNNNKSNADQIKKNLLSLALTDNNFSLSQKSKKNLVINSESVEFAHCEVLSEEVIKSLKPLERDDFQKQCQEYVIANPTLELGSNADYLIERIAELGGRCKCRPSERICSPGCPQMKQDLKLWNQCVCGLFKIKKG